MSSPRKTCLVPDPPGGSRLHDHPLRVVLGEGEPLLREGMTLMLTRAGLDVVAAVGDASSLLSAGLRHRPDVTITDLRMPPTWKDDGLRAGLSLRERLPTMGLLVAAGELSRSHAARLLSAGGAGVGYLWKHRIADAARFVADVRTVAGGGTVLDPSLAVASPGKAGETDAIERLSRRQREVLALVAQGLTNAGIADALFITEKSVVEHVSKIYDVLDLPTGAQRRVLAAVRYLGSGQRVLAELRRSRAA